MSCDKGFRLPKGDAETPDRAQVLEQAGETVKTVVHCGANQFCPHCKETGGEHPLAPLEFYCMSEFCQYPGKPCLYCGNLKKSCKMCEKPLGALRDREDKGMCYKCWSEMHT